MTLRGKTVLVTGATGFIGGRLVEKLILEHGAIVRALVRDFRKAIRLGRFDVELVLGDVTDPQVVSAAAKGCDVIFHCAFGASGTVQQQRAATVDGTRHLVDAAVAAGVRRFVHVSTLSVYGDLKGNELTESAPRVRTGDVYGDTKLEAEEIVLSAHQTQQLSAVVLQPTVVYGPFGGWWTAGQLDRLKAGRFALANGGEGVCNPVYVDDVVQAAIRAALADNVEGQTFLVSGPAPVTWRDYYAAMERMLGRSSTLPMNVEEIRQRQKEPRKPRTVFGWALQVLRERPDIRQRFVNSPILGLPYRVLSKLAPRKLLNAAKRRVLGADVVPPETQAKTDAAEAASPADSRPIIVPDAASLSQFTSPTRVNIDKARAMLGYAPQYDLSRGMALTEQWARWAGLLS